VALWTAIIHPSYAPDIKIVGADAKALAGNLNRIFVLSREYDPSAVVKRAFSARKEHL